MHETAGFIDHVLCHPIHIYHPAKLKIEIINIYIALDHLAASIHQNLQLASSMYICGRGTDRQIDHQKEVKQSVWSAEEASSLQGECVWRPSYVVITMRQSVDSRSTRFFTRQLL